MLQYKHQVSINSIIIDNGMAHDQLMIHYITQQRGGFRGILAGKINTHFLFELVSYTDSCSLGDRSVYKPGLLFMLRYAICLKLRGLRGISKKEMVGGGGGMWVMYTTESGYRSDNDCNQNGKSQVTQLGIAT